LDVTSEYLLVQKAFSHYHTTSELQLSHQYVIKDSDRRRSDNTMRTTTVRLSQSHNKRPKCIWFMISCESAVLVEEDEQNVGKPTTKTKQNNHTHRD